jgi:hypothetical protein
MKIQELFEANGNQYFRVTEPLKVWALAGHVPSNHYYGASRMYAPKYKEVTLKVDDEIHWLLGGLFAVEVYNDGEAGEVRDIRLTPPEDFSPFEKNYGGGGNPTNSAVKKMLDDGKLLRLAAADAAVVKQYRK